MKVYGSVVNGVFVKAPSQIRVNGRLILSPRSSDYEKAGYLPIDSSNNPPEGYKDSGMWEVQGDKIGRKYVEIPQEEQEYVANMEILSGEEAEQYHEMQEIMSALEGVI